MTVAIVTDNRTALSADEPTGRANFTSYMPDMRRIFKRNWWACLGQPVAENPTGVMQEASFRALRLNWRNLTVEVPPENWLTRFWVCVRSE